MDHHDHLFELIKSLSRSEKGYFKKINSFHVKGAYNNYMLLFDAIDKMESFNERKLQKQLKGLSIRQLPFLRHYLYNQLLDALDQYYQSSNVEINKFICKVEILYKKGLIVQGKKLLEKALAFAWKKEKFAYLLQLTSLRYEFLADEENKDKLLQQKGQLSADLAALRNMIDNLYGYQGLRIELNLLRAETGYARTVEQVQKYESLLNHPLLASEDAALSGSAKFHFHTLRAIIQNYAHHYAAAYTSLHEVESLFAEFPVLFEESISARIKTYQRKSAVALTLGRFNQAMEDVERMRAIKAQHEKYKALIFQNGFHQEFLIYLLTGRFQDLLKRVPAFLEGYAIHRSRILKTFELQLLQRIGQAYFIEGKYDEALEWFGKAVNTTPPNFRDDVVSGIKMDEILTHFELGNRRVVKSKVAAAQKYLRSKNKPFTFEQFLLSFAEEHLKIESDNEKPDHWKKAYVFMESAFDSTVESVPVKYFYMKAWIESKISGEPLSTVLKRHVKNFRFPEEVKLRKKKKLPGT